MTHSQSKGNVTFTRGQLMKNFLILCVAFFLLLTAYNAIRMLQSTVYDYKGTAAQALIYFVSGISTLLLPEYAIKRFGHKNMLIVSMICYIPHIAAHFYVTWFTMMTSSFLFGLVDALLLSSACTYISGLAKMYNAIYVKNYSNRINKIYTSEQKSIFVVDNKHKVFDIQYSIGDGEQYVKKSEAGKESGITELSVNNNKCTWIGKGPSEHYNNEAYETSSAALSFKFNNEHKSLAVEDSSNPKEEKAISVIAAIFFGIFDFFYLSASISGNFMSYFVIEESENTMIMSKKHMNCSCGPNFCNNELNCLEQNLLEFDDFMRNILTSISVGLGAFAVLLIFLFLDTLEREKEAVRFSFDLAISTFKFLRCTKALLLIPLTVCLGLLKGFFIGDFTKSFIACAWNVSHIGFVCMIYGAGCGIAATISGVLVKLIGRVAVMVFAIAVNTGTAIYCLVWNPLPEEPLPLFVTAALWGVVFGIISPQIKAYYGVLFQQEEEVGFAALFLWSAVGTCMSFSYSSYICTYMKIYILLIVSLLGVICYLITEYMQVRRSNSVEKSECFQE